MKKTIKDTKGEWIKDESRNLIFANGGEISFSGIKKKFRGVRKPLQINTKEK